MLRILCLVVTDQLARTGCEPHGTAAGRAAAEVDVYAIGFQEFVDLNAQALLREATDMHVARRRECQARLDAALAKKHGAPYVAVQVEQMVGVVGRDTQLGLYGYFVV